MMKRVWIRWFWCLPEYLMIVPVIFFIAGFILPMDKIAVFALMLPIHTLLAIGLTAVLQKFRNVILVVASLLYVSIVSWLWIAYLPHTAGQIILVIAVTAFFFFWGIRAGIAAHARSVFIYSVGLVIHGIVLFLVSRAPSLIPLQGWVGGIALLYVITGLPFANRRFLMEESLQKSSLRVIPGSVLHGNKIIIGCLLAGIILLSFWQAFIDAVLYLATAIMGLISKVMEFIGSLITMTENEPNVAGPEEMLPPMEGEESIFSLILNVILLLALVGLFIFAIVYLFKNHKRIIRTFLERLAGLFGKVQKWGSTEQGFVDRQESLLKTKEEKKPSFFKKLLQRELKWRDMKDNAAKVRFIYTHFVLSHIRKGFSFNPSDTPDETVTRISDRLSSEESVDELKNAYNQVRYGAKETTNETVSALKKAYLK